MGDVHAAASPASAIAPAVAILAAGFVVIIIARFTKLSSIVGFLIAGILLGDQGGVGLLHHDNPTIHLLAELGVVFLLFDIGLHFSVREMRDSRKELFVLAPIQMALGTAIFGGIALILGASGPLAIILGGGFALSSTAVVARLLNEEHLNTCPLGKSALAILVFQDIVAIFLLILAGSLGEDAGSTAQLAGEAFVKAVIAFAAALLLGRYVAKPVFQFLARLRAEETFPIAVLLIILASSTATAVVGLSMTLGAFLAGMIVAHSPYRPLVQTEVRPFRALLLSFFFMTVGMSLNIQVLLGQLPLVILVATGALIIKTVLIAAAALASGWSRAGAVRLAALLAQTSEFALVILGIPAVVAGLAGGPAASVLIAGAALSIALAPGWSWLGKRAATWISQRTHSARELSRVQSSQPLATDESVVVVGLTEAGRLTIDALRAHKLPFIALETDPERHAEADAIGYPAALGDTADMRFWEAAGATKARAIVLGRARYDMSRELTPILRDRFPNVVRFVAVDNVGEFVRHNRLGMRAHLLDREPKGVEMVIDVLRHMDVSEEDINDWVREVGGATPDLDSEHAEAA